MRSTLGLVLCGLWLVLSPGCTKAVEPPGGSDAGLQAMAVRVAPATSSLIVGDQAQLEAIRVDASDAEVPGGSIVWSSSDPSIATVSATGLVMALGPGQASITAAIGKLTGSATVAVSPVPVETVTLPAGQGIVSTAAKTHVAAQVSGNVHGSYLSPMMPLHRADGRTDFLAFVPVVDANNVTSIYLEHSRIGWVF